MILFDEITSKLEELFSRHLEFLNFARKVLVNRDLTSRVRFIFTTEFEDAIHKDEMLAQGFQDFKEDAFEKLNPHIWPVAQQVLFEQDFDGLLDSSALNLEVEQLQAEVKIIDRLATSANWAEINEVKATPRVVFFSIKGGVGRSSALAATAWHLAELGKKVMVLDLDLESPGLSTSLLTEEKQPAYGITDWLVEDLVENGDAVIDDMYATSELSRDGEIYVVPAHGVNVGDYIVKLGRAWMPKFNSEGNQESWAIRLQRLINQLEQKIKPDVILIDSRSGIDDIAANSITHLGANLILLFAIEGSQSWNGYSIIFDYWQRRNLISNIRERLQMVAALVPEIGKVDYLKTMQTNSYNLFSKTQYDEILAGEPLLEQWHFEPSDISAPHYPWVINWHNSFTGLNTLHGRLVEIDKMAVQVIFGDLVNGVEQLLTYEVVDE